MLKTIDVLQEEEDLRKLVAKLPPEKRKQFHIEVENHLRDPDTFAVLNWFAFVGLHHFYLGKWGQGFIFLFTFLLGSIFIIFGMLDEMGSNAASNLKTVGWGLIGIIVILETYDLFRSQTIIRDHNNKVSKKILAKISSKTPGPQINFD